MTLQEMIEAYKRTHKLTDQKIAELASVTRSTVARWRSGEIKNVSKETIQHLKQLPDFDVSEFVEESFHKPILGYIKGGYDLLADENYMGTIPVSQKDNYRGDYFFKVHGNSMQGVGIIDGSYVFVKQMNDVESNSIAVVLVGEEATVKKVVKKENLIILEAANAEYENRYYTYEEVETLPLRILGKVIWTRTEY